MRTSTVKTILNVISESDSIGIKWAQNNRQRTKFYLFNCKSCDRVFSSKKSEIKYKTGYCQYCSRKQSIKKNTNNFKLRPYEARYNNFKSRCPETDLSYEDYLEFTKINFCTYCDEVIPWTPYGNTPGFFLDRMYNEKGHIKGNLTVCCGPCNRTKHNEYTYDEFILLKPALKKIKMGRIKRLL